MSSPDLPTVLAILALLMAATAWRRAAIIVGSALLITLLITGGSELVGRLDLESRPDTAPPTSISSLPADTSPLSTSPHIS